MMQRQEERDLPYMLMDAEFGIDCKRAIVLGSSVVKMLLFNKLTGVLLKQASWNIEVNIAEALVTLFELCNVNSYLIGSNVLDTFSVFPDFL